MNSFAIACIPHVIRVISTYLTIGAIFSIPFVTFLVRFVDPSAKGLAIGFRLLIIPGVCVFWPLFVWRLVRRQQTPTERNIHRLRAQQNAA